MTITGRADERLQRALAILLVLGAAIPMLLPAQPWLIDLPGHIARYHVQQALPHSPELARWFGYQWKFLPNLGLDLLMVPLARIVGEVLAARLLVAAIPAITVAAMLWIARETQRSVPATSLIALPLALAFPLTYGFVNSCLAIALALLAFAWWLRLSRAGRTGLRTATMAGIAPLLLTTHIIGFGVLGLLVAGSVLGDGIARRDSPRRIAIDLAVACLPIGWPLLVLILASWGGSRPTRRWFDWQLSLRWMATMFREGWQTFDLTSALLLYVVAALPLFARRHFAFAPSLTGGAVLLWLAALILPSQIAGSEFASVRLLPPALAVTLLAIRPRAPLPKWVTIPALLFVAARLVSAGTVQLIADHAAQAELAALDQVARGSRVAAIRGLPCQVPWSPPRLLHLASLATARRDAFVNDQFAETDGQLLRIKPAVAPALRTLLPAAALGDCTFGSTDTFGDTLKRAPLGDADYLWLMDVPAAYRPRDARLRPLWHSDRSILYAIAKPGADR
jgi:hypothetical protein